MTTTDTHEGTPDTTVGGDAVSPSDATSGPTDQAKDILAKARYDAFRLMTDARKEAEEILEDARSEAAGIVRDAEMQAESIVDAAHVQAAEVARAAPEPDPGSDTAEAVASLEQEHEELTQRVSSLRELADQLEERFAALAETANASQPSIEGTPRPVLDYSPSVPHEDPADAPEEPSPPVREAGPVADGVERGSFYSRRSAKLPRIGDAGGKSALDMMRAIRGTDDTNV